MYKLIDLFGQKVRDFPKILHFPNTTLSAGPSSTYKSVYLNGHIHRIYMNVTISTMTCQIILSWNCLAQCYQRSNQPEQPKVFVLWYGVNTEIQNISTCWSRHRDEFTTSLLPAALHHGIILTGVLQTGRRPCDWPAERTGHLGLDAPLEEVKHGVPPGVSEVVVRRTL